MTQSLVQHLEEVIEKVSDWATDMILEAVNNMTVNSGPFGHVKLSPEEQLEEYAKIHGNAQAWYSRIEDTAQSLIGQLKEAGVPENEIMRLSPYTMAIKVQAKYALDMQKLAEKQNASSPAS